MILRRTRWHLEDLEEERTYDNHRAPKPEPDVNKANLIGSLLPNGNHAPCIDLDFPCRLIPSRTPGHFHLYLEQETDWEHYRAVLEALCKAGYVQFGFYKAAVKYEQTFVRPPTVAAPACTTVPADGQDVIELLDVVRAAVGGSGDRDALDQKIAAMEEHVYSMMAAKLDEIVARRVQRGTAVPSEEVPEPCDSSNDASRRIDVHRLQPVRVQRYF